MVHGKQRVISVAQHRKGLLHRLGREAMELYPVNPTTAFKYVMDKLEEENVRFLDHDLDVDNLPDYFAHWYHGFSDAAGEIW